MYMETGGKNGVTATVLLPKLKVLLPTHGLCHVYGSRRENVVTAMVLLPTLKVLLPAHGL